MKIAAILLTAFIVGNTLTIFVASVLGAIGGTIGVAMAKKPFRAASTFSVAPWRDDRWRALAKQRLGEKAPEDLPFVSLEVMSLRLKMIEGMPAEIKVPALGQLHQEKAKSDLLDEYWRGWYEHFHQIVLEPRERTFEWHVRNGLNLNLQTASLYILISTFLVPSVRHWWLVAPSCIWTLLLLAESFYAYLHFTDRWQTLSEQLRYLAEGSA